MKVWDLVKSKSKLAECNNSDPYLRARVLAIHGDVFEGLTLNGLFPGLVDSRLYVDQYETIGGDFNDSL